jgi:hypothetical protein
VGDLFSKGILRILLFELTEQTSTERKKKRSGELLGLRDGKEKVEISI